MNPRSDAPKPVFLAGEGENELGGWSTTPPYRKDPYPGVLETLLLQVKHDGWYIQDGVRWKNIRKFRAGNHRGAEERNVLGACLMAEENGCAIIAFSRDSDGNKERQRDIAAGITAAQREHGGRIGIIGGCAVPCLEGWILAIKGVAHSEEMSSQKAENTITRRGIDTKNTKKLVSCIENEGLKKIPGDAKSLRAWLEKAEKML